MALSDQLKSLLRQAHQFSEDVLKDIDKNAYQLLPQPAFENKIFQYIELKPFGIGIIKLLQEKQFLEDLCCVSVDREPSNEVMGVQFYFEKTELEPQAYRIWVDQYLNMCWYRFVVLKEICQIYCDRRLGKDVKNRKNLVSVVYDLLHKKRDLTFDPQDFEISIDDDNYSEFLAFYMAINIICPEEYRVNIKELVKPILNDSENYNYTLYDIANAYKMPEYIITLFVKLMLKEN